MQANINALQSKLELHINQIRATWSFNHPQIIIIAVLVTVVGWQNFAPTMPSIEWGNSYEYTQEPSELVPCDYQCLTKAWVELRTAEIMTENQEQYRIESRYQALLEANALITEI